MPLSPSPLLPGTSPLPSPDRHPPNRRAVRLGGLLAVPVLLVSLVIGQLLLPHILFLAPGLQASAGVNGTVGAGPGGFQGFVYSWTRRQIGGGYSTPASLKNMQSEADDFHMNAVIIPVVANMGSVTDTSVAWHVHDGGDIDTLPDSDFQAAIRDARKANLLPILELVVQPRSGSADSIGSLWATFPASAQYQIFGDSRTIGQREHSWFDSYTAFAVHYAQMSAQYHLPYFIIGDGLASISVETDQTTRQMDASNIAIPTGDGYSCSGRRECGWRHVAHAIRAASYKTYGNSSQAGGSYSGKLIYAASWAGGPSSSQASVTEFDHITWWDAMDFIGVDAYFPLTLKQADVDPSVLAQAWHGVSVNGIRLSDQHDIYGRLEKVADTYHKQVIFTGAGYASIVGANSDTPTNSQDYTEQLNDMQALLETFSGAPWWAGAFWVNDKPFTPRESLPGWSTGSMWAGNTLQSSKPAGQWLATYYAPAPLDCSC